MLIKRYGLDDVIERRPMSIPVSRTYADATCCSYPP